MSNFITLYLKNQKVLEIDRSTGKPAYIKDVDLLPIRLRNAPDGLNLLQWADNRSMPIDRANAKRIYNQLALLQTNGARNMIITGGFSLNDSYWIGNDIGRTWETSNLYEHDFSEQIEDLALIGKPSGIIQNELTPEITTQGTYPKCWHREEDGIYLYKTNYNALESQAEYISSIIADILGIEHVHYDLVKFKGVICCKCKNICSPDISIAPMFDYLIYKRARPTSIIDWLTILPREWHEQFYIMLVFDAIIGNTDRHLLNWGVEIDNNNTGKILGLHPLFDHNCAVDIRDRNFLLKQHPSMSNNNMLQTAQYALNHLPHIFLLRLQALSEWYNSREAKKLFKTTYKRLDELKYLKSLLNEVLNTKN